MKMQIRNNTELLELQAQLIQVAQQLQEGKTFDVTIEQHREKRSINANNYSWALQDQIAKTLEMSIDEVHNEMVLQYGVIETISVIEEAWESVKRIFDYCKEMGRSTLNGKTFVHARVGVGTHLYNTKEMSCFLNGVVQEAKNLGIQTLEDKQLEEMISRWQR